MRVKFDNSQQMSFPLLCQILLAAPFGQFQMCFQSLFDLADSGFVFFDRQRPHRQKLRVAASDRDHDPAEGFHHDRIRAGTTRLSPPDNLPSNFPTVHKLD